MTSSFSAGFMSDHPFIESTLYTVNTWVVRSENRGYPQKMMTSLMNTVMNSPSRKLRLRFRNVSNRKLQILCWVIFYQQYPDNEIKTWSFSLAGTGCSIMAFGTTGNQSSFFDVPETNECWESESAKYHFFSKYFWWLIYCWQPKWNPLQVASCFFLLLCFRLE